MGFLQKFEGAFYAVMRIVIGGLFALHGSSKMFNWPTPIPPEHAIQRFSQGWFGGIIELVTGVLVAIGLFTRPAAFLASGTMAVAYFQFHKGYELSNFKWLPPINGGEPAVMYCFIFLFIAARGAGRGGLDKS
jgi:putative oxidoreductase